ncbi:MAG TPA: MFS transporter [Micromonosporaceae bacterium]|nr:MFS transporter [Micromonosporaceae bacterium]
MVTEAVTEALPRQSAASPSPPTSTKLNLVLAACCLGQFMVILDGSVVNVALGVINEDFTFRANSLQWVTNSYAIVYAGFLLLGGRLADLFGRRRMFLLGIVIFTLASLACGVAFDATSLVVARGFQGLGAAIMAPATLTVLGTTFTEPGQRARAFGLWGAAGGVGGAIGVLLGGMFTEWLSWRWILLINIPIGAALFAAVAYSVTETRIQSAERKLDIPGSLSITAGLMAVVYGIAEGALVPLGIGVVVLAFFFLNEAKLAKQPLVPLDFFRNRSVSAANFVAITASAAIFSVFYFFTLFMQQVLGYTPIQTGLVYLPLSLGIFLGARGLAPHVTSIGPRRILVVGLSLSALGMLWLSQASSHAGYLTHLLGPSILLGLGQGIVMTGTAMAATANLPYHQAGLASGVLNTTRQLGGAVGLAALVAISNAQQTLASGYLLAFLVSAGFLAVAIIPALFAPGGKR